MTLPVSRFEFHQAAESGDVEIALAVFKETAGISLRQGRGILGVVSVVYEAPAVPVVAFQALAECADPQVLQSIFVNRQGLVVGDGIRVGRVVGEKLETQMPWIVFVDLAIVVHDPQGAVPVFHQAQDGIAGEIVGRAHAAILDPGLARCRIEHGQPHALGVV